MAGLDWHRAPIDLREALSFTRSQVVELDRRLWKDLRVEGCALLSTCNRTELYLSCTDGAEVDAGALLCAAAGVEHAPFVQAFTACRGREAARRLMEVAGGLRSQIWGEDQIVTQVKGAIQTAREAGTADSVLETLFRTAVFHNIKAVALAVSGQKSNSAANLKKTGLHACRANVVSKHICHISFPLYVNVYHIPPAIQYRLNQITCPVLQK